MNARFSWRAVLAGIALAGAVGLVPVQAVQAADQKAASPQPSDALRKPLFDAQKAVQDKRYPDALAKLKEADGNAKKTPVDQHFINQLYLSVYAATGDNAGALPYLEAMAADSDPVTDAAQRQSLLRTLANINYQMAKDDPARYDKAIEFGNRAISAGDTSEDVKTLVAQAYYLKKDFAGASKFEADWVQAKINKGEAPESRQLQIWVGACSEAKDSECLNRALAMLVTYYPDKKNWLEAIGEFERQVEATKSLNNRVQLQLYRLMLDINALERPGEFTEAANLSLEQGSPGEAQSIVQKGLDSHVFTDPREKDNAQKLLESAKKRAVADRASLTEQEQDVGKAASGQPSAALGYAYFGYQQYDKAAQLLTAGLAKGGLKDEQGSRLLLGISQLRSGHKDEAIQSFQAVKGDPALEKLATLWVARAKSGTS
jgi:hypothetical protein